MLNLNMGAQDAVGGRSSIVTDAGKHGHAVYGPYDYLEPGPHVVEFNLEAAGAPAKGGDFLCAVVDVAHDLGRNCVARKEIWFSQLRAGRTAFTLTFDAVANSRYEYRVWVSGAVALRIDDYRPVAALAEGAENLSATLAARRFPEEEGQAIPFFVENLPMLRSLYERGIGVSIVRGATVLTVEGVSLFARSADDLTFIGEVFYENAYNFSLSQPACVVDIGMNIGLASLLFAGKAEVAEVHAFEPFRNTFDRASDNLQLNPALAAKISAHNVGLSDHDEDGTILIDQHGDSGAMTTVGVPGGVPAHLSLRDAGTLLGPIIAAARARGQQVVLKVDCEGSEFAIFRSLEQAGLLPDIAAFMVEWHAMFDGKTQHDLTGPLKAHGYLVFDRSPPIGNGFFYAARLAA